MIKIGISGFCGRMASRIFELAKKDSEVEVVFGLEARGHKDIGKTKDGVIITDNPQDIENCDCLIEFSTPQATVEHLDYLVKFKKCAVIGTTGLSSSEIEKIESASKIIPIVFSPNTSIGVNLLFKLVDIASSILKDYKVYIKEAHHIHKKDAPSGTAKKILEIINNRGFNIDIKDIEAKREDEIVGDHKIIFESEFDRLEIFHSAKSRDIFAKGALLAVKWIVNKEPKLYSMSEVLGLV